MNKDISRSSQFKKNQPFIWRAVTVFLLVFGSILAWNSYDDYGNTLDKQYQTLESQANLGAVHMAGALRSMDLVLQSVVDDARALPQLPAEVIAQRQQSWLWQFPEINTMATVDSRGRMATAESLKGAADQAKVRSFDASEREYFTFHRDAKPEDYSRFHLSRPFKTITNIYTIIVSRAIRGKDGSFQGVALVSLSTSYFDSILQQVLSKNVLDAAALHNRFGDIVYRLPNPDKYIGKNIADGAAFKLYLASDQNFTRYSGVTVTDGLKRILVFSKVANTNLDIGVSAQFDTVMSNWRLNTRNKVLTFFLVAGLSLALTWEIQRHLTERQARDKAEQRFRAYFERSMVGMATITAQRGWIDVNPALCEMLGYPVSELLTKTWPQLCVPQDLEYMRQQFGYLLSGEVDEFETNKRFIHRDGKTIFVHVAARAVRKSDGTIDYVVVLLDDITKMHRLAFFDSLTKLPNRSLLNERMSQALASSKRSGHHGAVMFLDLDNFKTLNDTHGHDAGDALLLQVADRLKHCVRGIDTVARFGGDEFVIVLGELAADKAESKLQAETIAEKIRARVSEPYQLTVKHKGEADCTIQHRCTASIGIALFINDDASQDEIFKWADTAMYKAKDAGRNSVRVYDAGGPV